METQQEILKHEADLELQSYREYLIENMKIEMITHNVFIDETCPITGVPFTPGPLAFRATDGPYKDRLVDPSVATERGFTMNIALFEWLEKEAFYPEEVAEEDQSWPLN